MYYTLSNHKGAEPNVFLQPLNNKFVIIGEGELITDHDDIDLDELPFRFEMRVRKNPDGSTQEPQLQTYFDADELMHKDLVEALKEAGVDNLQTFPAELIRPDTNEVNTDYVVVNIVGLVACAAVDKSESLPFADGLYIHDLVIDPAKACGQLMFILAETKMDVLVHESVAKKLLARDFPFLVLTPVKEVSK